ncbi:hypothetical protein [Zavarzinia compransoris]|uniref:Uncharacterized protein n=1 Tax=Zavarzinia compransoris TaxID=1264899 RepID=A0A317E2T8_9PROT|nr:hypothetical protein [Zavarzinia compransoris]PWR20480.1 hypothetical protein DKG75_10750 [Zavarzinia compransoris]
MPAMRGFLALILVLAVAPALAGATRFLTGSEDVPLMEGLTERGETRTVFDTPGGRIVDVETEGGVSAEAVRRYYEASLPALGWRRDPAGPADGTAWRRASEVLVITIRPGHGGGANVRFNLRPVSL